MLNGRRKLRTNHPSAVKARVGAACCRTKVASRCLSGCATPADASTPCNSCQLHRGGLRPLQHALEPCLEVGCERREALSRRGQEGHGAANRATRQVALGAGPDGPGKRWSRLRRQSRRCSWPGRSLRNLFTTEKVPHKGTSTNFDFASSLLPAICHSSPLQQGLLVGHK